MKRYILSCVGSEAISSSFLSKIQNELSSFGVVIEREEVITRDDQKELEFFLLIPDEVSKVKYALMDLSNQYQIDLAIMPDDGRRDQFKLIVFDMDSTLIQQEVIDEMALFHGVGEEVKKITERAMNGELNFNEALKARVLLLKGFHEKSLPVILSRLTLTPGVEEVIKKVKETGYKTALISGGFKFFAQHFKEKLGLDEAHSNDLDFEGEELSGKIKGEIINAEGKAQLVEELARRYQLKLDQVVAVGDGANDLLMLSKAGFGVAFHAKEHVKKLAPHRLSHGPMTHLLTFLGLSPSSFREKAI